MGASPASPFPDCHESPSQPPRGFRPFVIYPTDKMLDPMPECRMETQPTSQIACVDTMDGGVLVEFEVTDDAEDVTEPTEQPLDNTEE